MKRLTTTIKTKILFSILAFTGIANAQTFTYDLESDYQNWIPDFADYPIGDSANWNFASYHQIMPSIIPAQYGIKLKGDNNSDDLFFWVKRKISGLTPSTQYQITFSLDIVTDMPPNGIGGSDLILKAGATIIEPKKITVSGNYRMNINKGNQASPGPDMDTLGHVNHTIINSFTYHLVNFTNSVPFNITSDANGEIWVIIGAESQFETPAEFLIAQIGFDLSSSVGIHELSNSLNISVFPNPFSTQTTLQSDKIFKDATLTVYNSFGQQVKQLKNISGHSITLYLDNLTSGLYFIRMIQDTSTFSVDKIVIKDK